MAVIKCALLLLLVAGAVSAFPFCPIAQGDSCEEVKFYLWTRLNPGEPQRVTAANITASHFNASNPTRMVVHGYASGMDLPQLAAVREEYLLLGPHNLISPQYLELVDSPCYLTAVANVDYIGKCIARFIRGLDVPRTAVATRTSSTALMASTTETSSTTAAAPADILALHVIGFSLGGQTVAFAAKHLRPEYLLDRITGLDPAFPGFMTSDKDAKLSPDDAVFVDVVHTNAYAQGQGGRCGHVDFYMNGGVTQPGCNQETFWSRLKCDHHRAPEYFAESVRSDVGFWGWRCDSIVDYDMGRCPAAGPGVLAGQPVARVTEGFYIVETGSEKPFARGRWWHQDLPSVTST